MKPADKEGRGRLAIVKNTTPELLLQRHRFTTGTMPWLRDVLEHLGYQAATPMTLGELAAGRPYRDPWSPPVPARRARVGVPKLGQIRVEVELGWRAWFPWCRRSAIRRVRGALDDGIAAGVTLEVVAMRRLPPPGTRPAVK